MDLYDDIDTKPRTSQIDGWSSGIKMLQTQLAVKKAQLPKIKETLKKPLMTPVINLRAKRLIGDGDNKNTFSEAPTHLASTVALNIKPVITTTPLAPPVLDDGKKDDWGDFDEYDPLWPNEYEKLKEKTHKSSDKGQGRSNNNRDERDRKRGRGSSGGAANRIVPNDSPPIKYSGFGQRQTDEESYSPPIPGSVSGKGGGAAIAPPPSLQEISIDNGDGASNVTIPYSASSVAAKIMAKYGFKDGQGLGKQEQGMSVALQVEKTSKRGGRIIHEKDVFLPPPPTTTIQGGTIATNADTMEMPPPPTPAQCSSPTSTDDSEPSITEIMKAPSKVVLLRNMVGPGDVDEELEPEVKDECNTKYGEVCSVIIHEAFGTTPEEAVKIFVEFKRIESAIKAVVDLNGRFFGGRQVRAGFYNYDKFKSFQLN